MGWEKEYEHWRDKGKTWGPGVDDGEPYTDEELAAIEARQEAYKKKIKEASVEPREIFKEAGVMLKDVLFKADNTLDGPSSYSLREEYNKTKLDICKEACKSLGYTLDLGWARNHVDRNKEERSFSVSVEYHGWLPDRGGNIHDYFVSGIKSIEDCLQLVADFGAIGAIPTTWYGENFHYSTRNTGELRLELYRRFGKEEFEEDDKSLDSVIKSAVERSGKVPAGDGGKEEREID